MKSRFSVLAIIVVATLFSCTKERITGKGPEETVTRNLSNFTSIVAMGSSNIHIIQGASFKVEVKGYANLLPYYETKLVNGSLQVGYRDNVNVRNDNTEVFITMPVLNGLESNGSGDINTIGNFAGNTNFKATIAGSGNITISEGSTQNFISSIAGSGNINALNMITEKADINVSGSGNTEITATSQLKVKISGSGNVYYKGSPVLNVSIAGSGAVLQK